MAQFAVDILHRGEGKQKKSGKIIQNNIDLAPLSGPARIPTPVGPDLSNQGLFSYNIPEAERKNNTHIKKTWPQTPDDTAEKTAASQSLPGVTEANSAKNEKGLCMKRVSRYTSYRENGSIFL